MLIGTTTFCSKTRTHYPTLLFQVTQELQTGTITKQIPAHVRRLYLDIMPAQTCRCFPTETQDRAVRTSHHHGLKEPYEHHWDAARAFFETYFCEVSAAG